MIKLIEDGDIFESECQALVNPVNTQGVSEDGIALEFKKRFPIQQAYYEMVCKHMPEELSAFPGDVVYLPKSRYSRSGEPKVVLYAFTKDSWKYPSEIRWVESCLWALRDVIKMLHLKSVAIPALGCGLGRLDFKDVLRYIKVIMTAPNNSFPPDVEIYAPRGWRKEKQ